MGCDIHTYREKHVNGQWVTADEWEEEDYGDGEKSRDVPYEKRFTDRNYNLFGLLAKGTRGYEFPASMEARGLPFDASSDVKQAAEQWDGDGHSHSYLYLHELKALHDWTRQNTIQISGMKNRDELARLRESIAAGNPDWKLLYPYCQGTNDPRQVEFSIDVPASFIVGGGLDKIIALFDGVDGDNHRLVFWFDN